jgi:hypothetical protein
MCRCAKPRVADVTVGTDQLSPGISLYPIARADWRLKG